MVVPNLDSLNNRDLIEAYSKIIRLLKARNVIQSKNLIGDIGEYLAVSHYNSTPGLPNLQPAPKGTKNVDALSIEGKRYSIKTTSTTSTGTFWGLNPPGSTEKDQQSFEYVIIVVFDKIYELEKIIEIDWGQFLTLKKWRSRMNAWNISITAELNRVGKTVFSAQQ